LRSGCQPELPRPYAAILDVRPKLRFQTKRSIDMNLSDFVGSKSDTLTSRIQQVNWPSRRSLPVGRLLYYGLVGLTLFYIIFPIYWMVLSSFKNPTTLFTVSYWPTGLTPINYRFLALNEAFVAGVQNSVIVAGAVLVLTLACGSVAAYALGRLKFRGQSPLRYAILAMTAFPQISIVGGLYLLINNPCLIVGADCSQLSLYNNLASLIITYLILTLPLTIWFLAIYYKQLPAELEEAAFVDGATPFQAFYHILLPLSMPGLVTTGLLSFVIAWNEFLFALTFTLDAGSRTAPVAITFFGNRGYGALAALAAAVMVIIPVVVLAVIFRKQLTVGLTGFAPLAAPAESGRLQQGLAKVGLSRLKTSIPAKVLLVMIGLSLLLSLNFSWSAITFPYPLDYGEGPLLDQTVRLAQFENIYRRNIDTPPFTITNYPPLFVAVQVPFVWLFGPALWYGRLISGLSLVAAAIFTGLLLHALTRHRLAAIIGGLLLLVIPYTAYWSVFNRVDTLALALSLGALVVLVRWPAQRWSLFLTAVLLTAAVYTRQSYGLAAPLAAFVWLLSRPPRRRAFVLAALVGSLGLGLFGLLNWLTGGGFYFNVVTANANQFQMSRLDYFLAELWGAMPYLVVGSGLFLLLAGWFRLKSWPLIAAYLLGAALSGLTIGKVGSNVNYFLELSAAMSLAVGALIAWQHRYPIIRHGLVLLLALQVYLLLPGLRYHLFTQSLLESRSSMAEIMQLVQQADGPVLADTHMGFIPLAGERLYLQPFEVTQLAHDGVWDQTPLLRAIERQEFPVILVLQVSTPWGQLQKINWSPQMLRQIRQHYQQTELIDFTTFVYRPKASP